MIMGEAPLPSHKVDEPRTICFTYLLLALDDQFSNRLVMMAVSAGALFVRSIEYLLVLSSHWMLFHPSKLHGGTVGV